MIRKLRRRHTVMVTALAAVLPAVLAAAFLARKPSVVMSDLPAGLVREPAPLPRLLVAVTDRLGPIAVEVRITGDTLPPARLQIGLRPLDDVRLPDPLVYWSAQAAPRDGGLPPDAVLLGSLSALRPREFALPTAALGTDGRILLFGLGHGELAGELLLPTHSLIGAAHE